MVSDILALRNLLSIQVNSLVKQLNIYPEFEFTLKMPGSHQCRHGLKSMKLDESPKE